MLCSQLSGGGTAVGGERCLENIKEVNYTDMPTCVFYEDGFGIRELYIGQKYFSGNEFDRIYNNCGRVSSTKHDH